MSSGILPLLISLTVVLDTQALMIVKPLANQNTSSIYKDLDNEWEIYKTKYEKKYNRMEDPTRRKIWEQNIKFIQDHNVQYNRGEHSYYLGINQFTDMTNKEFQAKHSGLKNMVKRKNTSKFMTLMNVGDLPETVDWVNAGYVTSVKNQRTCGSCWSFSTTGSMEGQYFRKYGKLIDFSEQQLVDCSQAYGNSGCSGGVMDQAFKYIEQYGLEGEQDYPYSGSAGTCQYNYGNVVARIHGYIEIKQGNEQHLATAVATVGPISVGIDSSNPSFQSYSGGVYDEPYCSKTKLGHAVLVAGYGTFNGHNYWLVKNTWGTNWGINGYIRMSKDKNNQCGIATWARYPIIM